ncbi:peptidoglycan DD-metalloendopeptidase family protein [Cyclobacterium xiamenense]|uniref:peptidoglycan DD-metalloendopeptidase family protein n=1 Tax=Cyclobacterium xiamenense TaxID=1297121 RepID=UPI0035D0EA73
MATHTRDFFPLMGETFNSENSLVLDMSVGNKALHRLDLRDTQAFSYFISDLLAQGRKKYGVGGYAENRIIYQRSEVFAHQLSNFRNIHLGIDIWAAPGTAVYCPLQGKVHSFRDNSGFGNYGPTIILEHRWQEKRVFSLYGHLSIKDLNRLKPGQTFLSGEKIGHLGHAGENGNWPPHVHFQIIRDLGNWVGDYPGVCAEMETGQYLSNCPDPSDWLGLRALRL